MDRGGACKDRHLFQAFVQPLALVRDRHRSLARYLGRMKVGSFLLGSGWTVKEQGHRRLCGGPDGRFGPRFGHGSMWPLMSVVGRTGATCTVTWRKRTCRIAQGDWSAAAVSDLNRRTARVCPDVATLGEKARKGAETTGATETTEATQAGAGLPPWAGQPPCPRGPRSGSERQPRPTDGTGHEEKVTVTAVMRLLRGSVRVLCAGPVCGLVRGSILFRNKCHVSPVMSASMRCRALDVLQTMWPAYRVGRWAGAMPMASRRKLPARFHP